MRKVTWKENSDGKDLKGGFVRSAFIRGRWYWNFYESSQLKWSVTGNGDLKENANWTGSFLIDGITHSNRDGKEVKFLSTPHDAIAPKEYALIFANETDAMHFNGEEVGQ